MTRLLIGNSVSRAAGMIYFMSDFHYGMSGTGHSYRYDPLGAGVYYVNDYTPWYRPPVGPDTSFKAVQKTPFYKRSIKTGAPSELLSNLISTL